MTSLKEDLKDLLNNKILKTSMYSFDEVRVILKLERQRIRKEIEKLPINELSNYSPNPCLDCLDHSLLYNSKLQSLSEFKIKILALLEGENEH